VNLEVHLLPFLNNKRKEGHASSVVAIKDRDLKDSQNEPSGDEGPIAIDSCMEQFLAAIQANDAKAMSDALYDAHEIMHGRGSQEQYKEPHSYDAQNEIGEE